MRNEKLFYVTSKLLDSGDIVRALGAERVSVGTAMKGLSKIESMVREGGSVAVNDHDRQEDVEDALRKIAADHGAHFRHIHITA